MSGARLLLSPSPNGILQRVNLFSSCIYSLRAQWHVSDRQRLFTHRGNVSSFRRGPIRRMNSELAPLAPACWDDECAFKRLTQHAADCRSLYCPCSDSKHSSRAAAFPGQGRSLFPATATRPPQTRLLRCIHSDHNVIYGRCLRPCRPRDRLVQLLPIPIVPCN